MLFSKCGNASRIAQMGRMRGKDEQQIALRDRLKYHATTDEDERERLEREALDKVALTSLTSGIQRSRQAIAEAKRREAAERKAMLEHPEWFEKSHLRKDGKRWSMMDAVGPIQALARGRRLRNLNQQKLSAQRRAVQQVFATRIQIWWRTFSSRVARQRRREAVEAAARQVLQRTARALVQVQPAKAMRLLLHGAASKIQRCFRSSRMRRVLRELLRRRLEAAVTKVQYAWREQMRWRTFLAEDVATVYEQAQVVKHELLFVDPNATKEQQREMREHRKGSMDRFMTRTGLLGRRIAFQRARREELGDHEAAFSFKEAMEVTKAQVVDLCSRNNDTRAVEEVLQDCRNRGVASLVITNFDGGMFRYPFGLRGNHGMFGLRTLYLDQNRILELPRDFYKLTNLTDVRLNANRIRDIRAEVRNLVGLQLFWVHQNLLRAVPMSIGELTNLVQLSLDDNQIATIPPQVANITSLQVLRLDRNPLVSPPPELIRTIIRPPVGDWDLTVVRRYLATLRDMPVNEVQVTAQVAGFGLLNFPSGCQTQPHLRSIDLTNNRIAEIPKYLYLMENLGVLVLDDNRIERISNHISLITSVTCLSIIMRYLVDTNNVMSGAKEMALISYRLRSLPDVDVTNKLSKISLEDNMLPSVPAAVLSLSRLAELCLANNVITVLPPEIKRLKRLRALDVSSNQLTALPKQIGRFEFLETLLVDRNRLELLHEAVMGLIQLRTLSLQFNQIELLPPDWSALGLWSLNLADNRLRSIPNSLHEMTGLRKLKLENNRLSRFPQSLERCKELESVTASNNVMPEMDMTLCLLGNLRSVDLSRNQLRRMPRSMAAMHSLTALNVSFNQLEEIDQGMSCIRALISLKMDNNFVTAIPPYIEGLEVLESLEVQTNRIQSVAVEIRYLSRLQSLILADNCIEELPPVIPQFGAVFGVMDCLCVLDVRNNRLRRLPLDLSKAEALKDLRLDNNPWHDNPKLRRVVAPDPTDAGGDLLVNIVEARNLNKMDGRSGNSDPFCVLRLQTQEVIPRERNLFDGTTKIPLKLMCAERFANLGNMAVSHTKQLIAQIFEWDQIFRLELDDNPFDDALEFELFDWDLEGAPDAMGAFTLPLTSQLLAACRRLPGQESSPLDMWAEVEGQDALGRPAKGQVRLRFEFSPLDGSLPSVQNFLGRLMQNGWLEIKGVDLEGWHRQSRVRATPSGYLYQDDKDELRFRDEVRRSDQFAAETRGFLRQTNKVEEWQRMRMMYTPQGAANQPWELDKPGFSQQWENMKGYLAVKAREDRAAAQSAALAQQAGRGGSRGGPRQTISQSTGSVLSLPEPTPYRPGSSAGRQRQATGGAATGAAGRAEVMRNVRGKENEDRWDRITRQEVQDELAEMLRSDFEVGAEF